MDKLFTLASVCSSWPPLVLFAHQSSSARFITGQREQVPLALHPLARISLTSREHLERRKIVSMPPMTAPSREAVKQMDKSTNKPANCQLLRPCVKRARHTDAHTKTQRWAVAFLLGPLFCWPSFWILSQSVCSSRFLCKNASEFCLINQAS